MLKDRHIQRQTETMTNTYAQRHLRTYTEKKGDNDKQTDKHMIIYIYTETKREKHTHKYTRLNYRDRDKQTDIYIVTNS